MDALQVRVLKVDAKNRRVDLTQRSEEERAAEKTLTEEGARTVKISGLNSLGAALARAGIRKQDFEDLSKVCSNLGEPARSYSRTHVNAAFMQVLHSRRMWHVTRFASDCALPQACLKNRLLLHGDSTSGTHLPHTFTVRPAMMQITHCMTM